MPKDKVDVTLKLEREQLEWINMIAGQYNLKDESKVARVLIDYAISDSDTEIVFGKGNTRCRYC